ncbi:MAG: aminotransferase class I/II-fold pyridoxal phosphate-dependent enzyme, partial [Myxococcaceae bacterium]|nr:aminotransferase class I/II-fold pyridoxal phosphate-dependent enzyme [Myxococcaceae bacterium]
IARLYQGVTADDVLVLTGAQEPIYAFMRATVGPGDHVICLTPTYQSLTSVAEACGAEVSAWEAREDADWQPDVEALPRLARPTTKLLVLNTPQNPTGGLLTLDRFSAAMAFAAERGLRVLGDEVYRGLEHAGPRLPSVVERSPDAVSLGAMAKVYGLAGLRIGWAVSRDRHLLEQLEAVKDYLSICAPGPSAFLATIALRHADLLRARTLSTVRRNVKAVDDFIARHAGHLAWRRPLAGTTALVRLTSRDDATAFCDELVTRTGVLLAPGPLFGASDAYVRVGLGRAALPDALAVLGSWLEHKA